MAVYNYIQTTGVIIPDTSEIRETVAGALKTPDAYGADFNTDSNTNQGKFVDLSTQTLSSVAITNAQLANQINPNIAGGVFLDGILSLFQYQRLPATQSLVSLVFTGSAGTSIPAQTQIRSTSNDIFVTFNTVVIGAGGTATGSAASLEYGEIPVEANTITQIPPASQINGWDTVNNPAAGETGASVQSDSALRSNYNEYVAFNSKNTIAAVQAALSARADVFSALCIDNATGGTEVVDTITLPISSMWVGVVGTISDDTVASVIMQNKAGGTSFVGDTEVVYVSPINGQNYLVKFDRGEPVTILCQVTLYTVTGATNVESAVIDAILNAASGNLDGFTRWGLNYDISAFEIASAIKEQVQGVTISKVEITTLDDPLNYSTDPIEISINQYASISSTGISIIIVEE